MAKKVIYVYQMGKVGSSSVAHSLRKLNAFDVKQVHYLGGPIAISQSLKVITMTRDPISRNISGFFQNFEKVTGTPFAKASHSIKDLTRMFLDKYYHDVPLEWFDLEFKKNTGIDVFNYPFDGHSIIGNCLVFRAEITDGGKEIHIRKFLGNNNFKMIRTGMASLATYGKVYSQFVKQVKLPKSYLNRFLGSQYVTHFYSDEYLQKRWKDNLE